MIITKETVFSNLIVMVEVCSAFNRGFSIRSLYILHSVVSLLDVLNQGAGKNEILSSGMKKLFRRS